MTLKEYLEYKRMSVYTFAHESGISHVSLYRYIDGRSVATKAHAKLIGFMTMQYVKPDEIASQNEAVG